MQSLIATMLIAFAVIAGAPSQAQISPADQPAASSTAAPAAQAQDEIIAAVRAYRAALMAGDLKTAIEHAGRAYRLSKERDGVTARTGLLAYNYATLELEFGDPGAAMPAAQDAASAPETGAANGPTRAAIQAVLGRAMLARGDAAGVALVRAGLAGADPARTADLQFGYRAGVALGAWFTERRNWTEAAETWRIVRRFAGGATLLEKPVAEATALLEEGQALMSLKSPNQALSRFREAETLLTPFWVESAGGQATTFETVYGGAIAWRSFLELDLREQRDLIIGAPFPMYLDVFTPAQTGQSANPRPCRVIAKFASPRGLGRHFDGTLIRGEVAAVVMRVALTIDGRVSEGAVIASRGLPSQTLERGVASLVRAAQFQRDPAETDQSCRLNSDARLVAFALKAQ